MKDEQYSKTMTLLSKREAGSERVFNEELAKTQGAWYGHARRLCDDGWDLCMANGPDGFELVTGVINYKVVWATTLERRDNGVCVFREYAAEPDKFVVTAEEPPKRY